ncbi:MAG: Uma2 family endonuclease [Pyrinomonadaceae bacterium]|nr:Uma2 family endonuclease [Pyrinomonadaceae bacterium]
MDAQITLESTTIYMPRAEFTFYFSNRKKPTIAEFEKICRNNRDMQIEMSKEGEISVMPPVHSDTSEKNSEIIYQLKDWSKKDKSGKVYESSGGFVLPNGAVRAPDACWILKERLDSLSVKERQGFMNICPDFVVELRSASDSLPKLKAKMSEYIENGAKLGWLIDSGKNKVYVYRQKKAVEVLENPASLSGEDILKGFELDLKEIL